METLTELIDLINQKRIKKVELFDERSRSKQSNYYKLFYGITSGKYLTDQEAAEDIYQCDASEKKYLILKSRLKQKILNTVFFLSIQPGRYISEYDATLNELRRVLYQSQTLMLERSYQVGLPLIEKAFKKAQELPSAEGVSLFGHLLAQYYAEQQDLRKMESFRTLATEAQQQWQLERQIQQGLDELRALVDNTRSPVKSKEIDEKFAHYRQLAIIPLDQYQSPVMALAGLQLQALQAQYQERYEDQLKVLSEQRVFLKINPLFSCGQLQEHIYLDEIRALANLERWSEIEQKIIQQPIIHPDSPNWLSLQELRMLASLHSHQYINSAQIFNDTVSLNIFRKESDSVRSRWQTFQAYLMHIGKSMQVSDIQPNIQTSKLALKMSDYIQLSPEYDKQQRGLNIARLSLQIITHLEKQDISGTERCIDLLSLYTRRTPQRDRLYRSECFIHLLQTLKQQDFRYYNTHKASTKLWESLQQTKAGFSTDNQYIEVMPYEWLWQHIMGFIKDYRYV
ncbi:hypothetical protein [Eisenibacter elegans]|uniref:hypothetical protein n=1 Tax=Eisenibacter elegans TaxID=997 RepID=UPI000413DED1|nr:hypothetical protein [Eisenibacter elegans]